MRIRSFRIWNTHETSAVRGVSFRIKCSVSIAALVACSWACASAPSFSYANGTDSKGNPAPQHFFVLPLNVAVPVPKGLKGTTGDVFSEVASYLRNLGNTIETISPEAAREQWKSSVAEVSASDVLKHDFDTAMQVFIKRARKSKTFDALIMPALVLRDVESRKRMIKWDGAVRKYQVINLSEEAKKKKIAGDASRNFAGVSLHVSVFGASGDAIFQNYGGLDLVHDLDMADVERTMRARLTLREKLLKNTRHLRQGIAHAFSPYLPPK